MLNYVKNSPLHYRFLVMFIVNPSGLLSLRQSREVGASLVKILVVHCTFMCPLT